VTNTGEKLFRVFDIELLKRPPAGEPLAPRALPHVTPQWEEKLARSSSVQLAAGEKTTIPASRYAILLIAIRGTIQLSGTDTNSPAPALQWGEYRFFPAQTRLQLANSANDAAEAILLELTG
jgi:hypothetical protein